MSYPVTSSFLHGLKIHVNIVLQNSTWTIKDGRQVMGWTDRWLVRSLVDDLE